MADDQQQSRRDRDREIDRLALDGTKTAWATPTDPAASDPVSDDERVGLNVLGQSDPRHDGALPGVSDPNAGDVRASEPITAPAGERRVSPPLVVDAGMGDGDISVSGGAAGGA